MGMVGEGDTIQNIFTLRISYLGSSSHTGKNGVFMEFSHDMVVVVGMDWLFYKGWLNVFVCYILLS